MPRTHLKTDSHSIDKRNKLLKEEIQEISNIFRYYTKQLMIVVNTKVMDNKNKLSDREKKLYYRILYLHKKLVQVGYLKKEIVGKELILSVSDVIGDTNGTSWTKDIFNLAQKDKTLIYKLKDMHKIVLLLTMPDVIDKF